MSKKKNSVNKNIEIFLLLSITFLSFIFWETPLVYPIKIFVILLHEINHAAAAIITGGSVKTINLNLNFSGQTITKGGNLIIIAMSGYIGSLLVGSLLFISADNPKFRNLFTIILSAIILLTATNLIQGGIQVFISLVIALFFYFVPRFVNNDITNILFKFIGLTSCFYVISDIKQDLLTTTLRETDTQILEYITGIPAIVIGFSWFIFSIVIVGFLIKKTYFTRITK